MAIPESAKADEYLQRIGYYRLSAYWYPFRKSVPQPDGTSLLENDFRDGIEFKHATDFYAFDKGLRLIVLDALERIEVSVRTEIALTMGKHSPKSHRDPGRVDGRFIAINASGRSMYQDWIKKLDDKERDSKEQFADHFRAKYPGEHMPIWIAVELLDFGPLSIFLSGMRYPDIQSITASYGLTDPHLIRSWIRSLSGIRNICAHHSRLWNRPLIHQPTLPRTGTIPHLDHVHGAPGSNKRLYSALAVTRVLLRNINPRTNWGERLKAHVATFPTAPNTSVSDMGFPAGWESLPLWA